MKSDAKTALILELLDAVRNNWWTVFTGAFLGLAAGIVALHYMPKTYEAATKVLVVPQQIPSEYVRTTVIDDMKLRMKVLQEAVLSRGHLSQIAVDYFGPVPQDEELELLIEDIRSRVQVNVRRGLFTLSFRDADPERAAAVANQLAQQYIGENALFRASRAEEMTDTLVAMAESALQELTEQERAISSFKAKHPYETEENLNSNLRMREMRQRDLEIGEQAIVTSEARLREARRALVSGSAMGSVEGSDGTTDPGRINLARIEQELRDLRLRYHDEHPSVKKKKKELVTARVELFGLDATDVTSGDRASNNPAELRLQGQVTAAEEQIAGLRDEQGQIKAKIAMYDRRIEATPLVEAQLADLTKGHDVLREQYRNSRTRVESAKSAQTMEESRKGEQFEIIEEAIPSSLSIKPNPKKVMGMAAVAGLLLFVGPLLASRALNPRVRSEAGLRSITDLPVLVTIPRLNCPATMSLNRRKRMLNIGLSVVSAGVLALVVAGFSLGVVGG